MPLDEAAHVAPFGRQHMVVFCILATLREAWFAQTIVDHLVTIVVAIDLDHRHIQ